MFKRNKEAEEIKKEYGEATGRGTKKGLEAVIEKYKLPEAEAKKIFFKAFAIGAAATWGIKAERAAVIAAEEAAKRGVILD